MKNRTRKYYERKVIPFHKNQGFRFPNSADRQYRITRLIDLALSCVTCLGAITTLAFLALL